MVGHDLAGRHCITPVRAARRPLRPYRQGAFDGLCGIYAAVNALSILIPELTHGDCRCLFRRLLRKTLDTHSATAASMWKGCGVSKLRKLLRSAIRHIQKAHGIGVQTLPPAGEHETLGSLWSELEARLLMGQVIIIGLSGVHQHWTVVRRMTPGTLWLADSDGLTLLRQSRCSLEERPKWHCLKRSEIIVIARADHPTVLDQANRLELELLLKLPSLHPPPPASGNTQSRCPRNRQQASSDHPELVGRHQK
ncbi:hypothetical protein [Methylobacterium sp. CM6244]